MCGEADFSVGTLKGAITRPRMLIEKQWASRVAFVFLNVSFETGGTVHSGIDSSGNARAHPVGCRTSLGKIRGRLQGNWQRRDGTRLRASLPKIAEARYRRRAAKSGTCN